MLRQLCEYISRHLPSTTIRVPDPETGILEDYLTRSYFLLKDWSFINLYLHHFHVSDKGLKLHNHPWQWAISLILISGYGEWRRMPDDTIKYKIVKPWSFNFITPWSFHKVDLLGKDCWTIILAGKRNPSWGFWDPETKQYEDFRSNPNAIP